MGVTSAITGALTSDLAKFAGKKFLESSFPQMYSLHKEYKQYKKEKDKKRDNKDKSGIENDIDQLDNDVKDTNTLLETEAAVLGNQTMIMEKILQEVSSMRNQLLLGSFGGGPDINSRNAPGGGPAGGGGPKGGGPSGGIFKNAEEAKKAGGGKYYDKNGRLQEMKPKPGGGFRSSFVKNVAEVKPSFLSQATSFGKGALRFAGGALRFAGRLYGPLALAGLAYDIHNATPQSIEEKMNDPLNEPGSLNRLLGIDKWFGGGKKKVSNEEKQSLNTLAYRASNSITFKSEELKITADKLVLSENLIDMLLSLASGAVDQARATAQADAQDRSKALLDVGARLGGGRSPAATSQQANPAEAEKNLTPVTAKKSGVSDKVGSAYASNFQGFLDDLEATGYQIKSLGGYSFRGNKNNPSMLSYHGLGAALDVNAATNPFHTRQTDFPPNIGDIAKAHGLGWGISFEDPMHFSAAKREGGSFDIAQQRMPGYASGTPYVPQTGIATVGELGSETIVGKSGIRKTAAGAHPMMLRKGESVIPAGEKRSSSEIMAEYQNAKAFADGTPQVRPLLAPGETTQPIQPIKIETPAEAKMKKYLEGVPYDPVLQAGMRKIGGAKNIIMKEDLLHQSGVFGAYIPPDAKGKNAASEKTLSAFRNKIFLDPEHPGLKLGDQTIGGRGPEQIKTTAQHELSHAATQEYWEKNLISPEMLNEIKGFTGKSPKDAGLYGSGLGEEARQRIRDLETRGEFMEYDELEGVSAYVNKYKPYNEKGLTPDQIDEYEASRDRMLSNLNKDVKRAFSSVDMLEKLADYK